MAPLGTEPTFCNTLGAFPTGIAQCHRARARWSSLRHHGQHISFGGAGAAIGAVSLAPRRARLLKPKDLQQLGDQRLSEAQDGLSTRVARIGPGKWLDLEPIVAVSGVPLRAAPIKPSARRQ
jgi:hypothetical protein